MADLHSSRGRCVTSDHSREELGTLNYQPNALKIKNKFTKETQKAVDFGSTEIEVLYRVPMGVDSGTVMAQG